MDQSTFKVADPREQKTPVMCSMIPLTEKNSSKTRVSPQLRSSRCCIQTAEGVEPINVFQHHACRDVDLMSTCGAAALP